MLGNVYNYNKQDKLGFLKTSDGKWISFLSNNERLSDGPCEYELDQGKVKWIRNLK